MKKLSIVSAVSSALLLSACGGGGGSSSGGTTTASTLSGTASKGILSNALVEAFLFENGEPDLNGASIASAMTDDNGEYSLSISSQHQAKPVFIKISSTNETQMKCDIAGGCDDDGDPTTPVIAFGAPVMLTEGALQMSAVVPQALENVAVNVTPLTTVSAELAIDTIQNQTGATDDDISVAIAIANSQVSTSFGLGADITQIPVVDLTDTADVESNAGSNDAALNYAAINAAIVSAKQDDSSQALSIGEAIETFASEVVSQDGFIANALNEDVTSLEDIYAEALEVLDEVGGAIPDAISALEEQLGDAQSEPETNEGVLEEPSDTSGILGNYAKVKAFVEELRELGVAIDSSIVGEGDSAQSVADILDGFEDQLDVADTLSSTDAEGAFKGLELAVNAMAEVIANETDDLDLESEDIGVDIVEPGQYFSDDQSISVVVATQNGETTFSVTNQEIEVEVDGQTLDVQLDVTATLEELSFVDNVIRLPGDTFTQSNIVGSYQLTLYNPWTVYTLDLDAGGSGSIASGDEQPQAISWVLNDDGFTVTGGELISIVVGNDGDNIYSQNVFINGQRFGGFLSLIDADGSETEEGSLSAELGLSIAGEVSSGSIELDMSEASRIEARLEADIDNRTVFTDTGETVDEQLDFELSNALIDLQAELRQVGVEDPVQFGGGIELSLSSIDVTEVFDDEVTYGPDYSGSYEQTVTLNRLGVFSLSFEGAASNASGESFDFELGFTLDGSGVPAYTEITTEIWGNDGYFFETETTGGETEQNYVDISAYLNFDAQLNGISDSLTVDFDIARTGYDDVEATLDLSYPGRDLELVANVEGLDSDEGAQGSLTLTNVNDGIVVFVEAEEAANDDEFSVEIRMDTNADGVVDENDLLFAEKVERNGIEFLQYINEDDPDNIEFESLF